MTNSPYVAVILGIGLGCLVCIGGEGLSSMAATSACERKSNHQVVSVQTFVGSTHVCVDNRYLQ